MGEPARPVVWAPQPGPQHAFITCPIFEVVYGGARGGGKTDAALGEWAIHAERYGAKAKGLFVRRTRVALEPTIERAKALFRPLGATWQDQKSRFVWPSGAILYFRYLDKDADADSYQGHDYTRVYVEELTQFASPDPVDKLKATLRSAEGVPTSFRATCNPGGPGHGWVKARYIDPGPWNIITESFENPFDGSAVSLNRVFIPAKLSDNPRLLENDPLYVAKLQQSGSAQLVRAWLQGDWNIIEGAFFDCWTNQNVVRPFDIPKDWPRFWSGDWGSYRPFSFGLWTVVGDRTKVDNGYLPRGCLLRVAEWYGADKPNIGLKLPAEKVGEGLVSRYPGPTIGNVLDPACFASDGGPTIAERLHQGIRTAGGRATFRPADNKRVGKLGAMGGWDQMRARMIGNDDGPMLACFATCHDSIRTIPVLQHDSSRLEDLDTDGEDHAADDWRYACMSRPWTPALKTKDQPKRDRYADDEDGGRSWKTA